MPFGLKNNLRMFQRVMNDLLSKVKWKFALVHLDKIVIFSRTTDAHTDHVGQVLTLLKDAGTPLSLRKSEFFTNSIDYLGHVIRRGASKYQQAR